MVACACGLNYSEGSLEPGVQGYSELRLGHRTPAWVTEALVRKKYNKRLNVVARTCHPSTLED